MALKGIPARSALQIPGVPDTPDKRRAFNPARDMVWGLPRIMTRAMLEGFGIEDPERGLTDSEMVEHVKKQFTEHLIPQMMDDDVLLVVFTEFIEKIQDFFGLAGKNSADLIAGDAFKEIYTETRFKPFILLLSKLTMRRIFAELPYWFEQVEPLSSKAPRPSTEEVEAAANALLQQLSKE